MEGASKAGNPINLFIDTNRYLNIYGFSKSELDNLKNFVKYLRENKIIIWLPEQIKNEVERDAEKILIDKYKQECVKLEITPSAEKALTNEKIRAAPENSNYKEETDKINSQLHIINKSNDEIRIQKEKIRQKIRSSIKTDTTLADSLIKEIFSLSKFYPYEEDVIQKAFRRHDLGNPPGKLDSYGDSVVWETLLKYVPKGEDLHFVGADKDYYSQLNEDELSPFLSN